MIYLDKNKQPTENLLNTLAYYGITLDEFKQMTDDEVRSVVSLYSDVLNDGVERKTGEKRPRHAIKGHFPFGDSLVYSVEYNEPGNQGSFSRYFSLDAWSQKHLPKSVLKTFPFLLVPKASKSEKNAGLDGLPERPKPTLGQYKSPSLGRTASKSGSPQKNNHPTVKPVKLMAYLITMGSREGNVVFDPYLGSGTTAVACVLKKRHFVGCDIDPESCNTAELRVEYAGQEIVKEERRQLDMFTEAAQ